VPQARVISLEGEEGDAGRARGVDVPGGCVEIESAGPEGLETPMLLVCGVMVVPAEQHQVVGLGLAQIAPVHGVVDVAELGGHVAAEDPTAAVANGQRLVERVGDDS
jgi:hypothetical protein